MLFSGAYIDSFVATAPKSYAMRIILPNGEKKVIFKLKGFRQMMITEELITQELMERLLVIDNNEKVVIVYDRQVKRNFRAGGMFERKDKKTFRTVNSKRVLRPDLDFITLPYGY